MKGSFRFLVLLGAVLLGSPSFVEAQMTNQDVPTIEAKDLAVRMHAAKPPVLIDVREDSEWAESHIEGAKHIRLADLESHLAEIPKDQPVVVYCRSGKRSARAVMLLKELGYENAVSLTGGIMAWNKCGDPNKKAC